MTCAATAAAFEWDHEQVQLYRSFDLPSEAPVSGRVYCHSLSEDCTRLAASFGNEHIYIFPLCGFNQDNGTSECPIKVLKEHNGRVTGLDWSSPRGLASCGADRNAFVWSGESLESYLVMIHVSRAANCIRWSLDGQQFAVGSACSTIAVSHFDSINQLWIARRVHRSSREDSSFAYSILSIDWAGRSTIACACSDRFVRIVNVKRSEVTHCVQTIGWANSVSCCGRYCLFVSHGSSIGFLDASNGHSKEFKLPSIPFRDVLAVRTVKRQQPTDPVQVAFVAASFNRSLVYGKISLCRVEVDGHVVSKEQIIEQVRRVKFTTISNGNESTKHKDFFSICGLECVKLYCF